MKKKRLGLKHVMAAFKQADPGVPVAEVARRSGISEQTFYRWKKQDIRTETEQENQLRRLENARLKQLVADLTLDKSMLQDVLARILEARQSSITSRDVPGPEYHRLRRSNNRSSGSPERHPTTMIN
jgi:putative transposase